MILITIMIMIRIRSNTNETSNTERKMYPSTQPHTYPYPLPNLGLPCFVEWGGPGTMTMTMTIMTIPTQRRKNKRGNLNFNLGRIDLDWVQRLYHPPNEIQTIHTNPNPLPSLHRHRCPRPLPHPTPTRNDIMREREEPWRISHMYNGKKRKNANTNNSCDKNRNTICSLPCKWEALCTSTMEIVIVTVTVTMIMVVMDQERFWSRLRVYQVSIVFWCGTKRIVKTRTRLSKKEILHWSIVKLWNDGLFQLLLGRERVLMLRVIM